LGSLLFAGCQSNAQYDQVARELRMQEDQLYKLEDYLEEYQRLVCKYRSENAALKRQLADHDITPASGSRRTDEETRATPASPDLEVKPPSNGTTPPSDIETPDIPPLDATTSHDSRGKKRRPRARGQASVARADDNDFQTPVARAVALQPAQLAPVARDVWLHGAVLANPTGGGPRLIVKVEPLDKNDDVVRFDGALSLMLTTPNEDGSQASLARWDYRPQELRAAGDGKIQFNLELPPETPAPSATQLWVRLLPRRGEKLLAHAEINLHEPSKFSSNAERRTGASPAPGGEDAILLTAASTENALHGAAPVDDESQPRTTPAISSIFDGGWTIARPGHPAGLTTHDNDATSAWRASLEPPPSVTANSEAVMPMPRIRQPSESTESGDVAVAKKPEPRSWSPERSANTTAADSQTASRPTWSATR
jgi:hypothetical protein